MPVAGHPVSYCFSECFKYKSLSAQCFQYPGQGVFEPGEGFKAIVKYNDGSVLRMLQYVFQALFPADPCIEIAAQDIPHDYFHFRQAVPY